MKSNIVIIKLEDKGPTICNGTTKPENFWEWPDGHSEEYKKGVAKMYDDIGKSLSGVKIDSSLLIFGTPGPTKKR